MSAITAEQAKEIDRKAQEQFAIPGIILMEHAGLRAAEQVRAMLVRRGKQRVCVCCGPGNNGGDGYVVTRHLVNAGLKVRVIVFVSEKNMTADARVNYRIVKKLRVPLTVVTNEEQAETLSRLFTHTDMIVDALFGIGLKREIAGYFNTAIKSVNSAGKPVVSLDTPSGLCASTGKIWGVCVRAHTTITFAFPKKGFYLGNGPQVTGKVIVVDIGLPLLLTTHPRRYFAA